MKRSFKEMLKYVVICTIAAITIPAMSLAYMPPTPEPVNPAGTHAIPPEVTTGIGKVLGAAQWIGVIVGTGMIIYIGVKYLTAGAGKKAEAKETAIPLLIGAGLVMLAPTVAKWVFELFE